ncbi:MAG TPA: O-methyltransferase [Candidatus Sulfotelmatobacter sp.]|nr:O-methyltransferase [Candidatus Sulfotelmatobacter sp.]
MTQEKWTTVDEYLSSLLVPDDKALQNALNTSAEAGLPPIQVTPVQGKMLHLLCRSVKARLILELGTLGAYSTIWLARALETGGRVVTLEAQPLHAKVAWANICAAGLDFVVDLRIGRALDTLPVLASEKAGPFDFIFIDADKVNTAAYFQWSLKLSRPGTIIVVDNVVRKGAVADPSSDDPAVQAMQRFFSELAAEGRVSATALQMVGAKGYDGFALALVL